MFENVNLSRKRGKDEDFSDYRNRMKENNFKLKQHSKGRLIWNSADMVYNKLTRIWDKVIKQGTFVGVRNDQS